jgi:hypothetical protein
MEKAQKPINPSVIYHCDNPFESRSYLPKTLDLVSLKLNVNHSSGNSKSNLCYLKYETIVIANRKPL